MNEYTDASEREKKAAIIQSGIFAVYLLFYSWHWVWVMCALTHVFDKQIHTSSFFAPLLTTYTHRKQNTSIQRNTKESSLCDTTRAHEAQLLSLCGVWSANTKTKRENTFERSSQIRWLKLYELERGKFISIFALMLAKKRILKLTWRFSIFFSFLVSSEKDLNFFWIGAIAFLPKIFHLRACQVENIFAMQLK